MEDKCNTGGTHYADATGKEISEQEYLKMQQLEEKSGVDSLDLKRESTSGKNNKK